MSASRNETAEVIDCVAFEATLGLMDGILSGTTRLAAERHADGCAVCGPLVRSWAPLGEALRERFESAAERAKPDLAGVSDRVFARIEGRGPKTASAPHESWFGRLLASIRLSPALYAFGAAAAVAIMIAVPMLRGREAPLVVAQACDLNADVPPDLGEVDGESGFHMHALSFGSGSGTVMTGGDDLPVIWVTEQDGA